MKRWVIGLGLFSCPFSQPPPTPSFFLALGWQSLLYAALYMSHLPTSIAQVCNFCSTVCLFFYQYNPINELGLTTPLSKQRLFVMAPDGAWLNNLDKNVCRGSAA